MRVGNLKNHNKNELLQTCFTLHPLTLRQYLRQRLNVQRQFLKYMDYSFLKVYKICNWSFVYFSFDKTLKKKSSLASQETWFAKPNLQKPKN